MNNCIFCKIINKEIPSNIVYEDDKFLAFLDIAKATNGHTILIPKKHVKKKMDYAFIPETSQMKYDIEVSESDDFDV
jgi:galactose-1-phosphate uridylyltransferase